MPAPPATGALDASEAPAAAGEGAARLTTRRGAAFRLPLFLPVYHPRSSPVPIEEWRPAYGVEGCIVNAYLMYKQRELRRRFAEGLRLAEHLGFDGMLMTDSGAFQGFTGPLYLDNEKIVRFQDAIGADVVSPLDLVTPPGDNRALAEKKLEITQRRIRQAMEVVERSILAGVQQGGRYLSLRRRSIEELMEVGVRYVALGSLVPFFNRQHNLKFVGQVLREARAVCGPEIPIHVYGAGDPVELPFLVSLGASVFDSASYGHYAAGGWYMTPYGAVKEPERLAGGEYRCACPVCAGSERIEAVWASPATLAAHNLHCILDTVRRLRDLHGAALERYLDEVLAVHRRWFPDSLLPPSFEALRA